MDFQIRNGKLLRYTGQCEQVVVPDGIDTIDAGAFEGCKSLESIEIPSGVTEIKRLTFENRTSLETVVISSTVSWIGKNAFAGTAFEATLP